MRHFKVRSGSYGVSSSCVAGIVLIQANNDEITSPEENYCQVRIQLTIEEAEEFKRKLELAIEKARNKPE